MSGIFDSRRDENDTWNVSVDKFKYKSEKKELNESKFSLSLNFNGSEISTFDVKANHLKLETLSKIVVDNHLSSPENEKTLSHLDLRGEVNDFSISWQSNKLQKVNAHFSGFAVNAWQSIPKVKGLSGNVTYENKEGVLTILSNNATIGFPELFRKNFKLDLLNANINFTKTKQGLLFDTKNLVVKNADVEADSIAKLWLPVNGSSPHIDLQTHVSKGDISKVSNFLPVTIMDKELVDWLDTSLLKGKVNKSTVVLNGKLSDFPFDNKEGVFSVDVDVSDLTLKYLNNWPEISNADVTGIFTGQGLKIQLSSAESENNAMYGSYAEIESYINADLNIKILAKGSSSTAVQYLVNSPILSDSATTIDSMRFLGDVNVDMKINVPLSDEVLKQKSLSYAGFSTFSNASVFMLKDKIDITEGTGTLFFTEKGLSSKNLTANVLSEKANFSVTSKSISKDKSIKISIKGKIKPNKVLSRFEIPGAKNISGKTNYKAEMIFPDESVKNNYPTLYMSSKLKGIKSRFPDFLSKNKETSTSFKFKTIFTPSNRIQFAVALDKYGSAIIELDQSGKNSFLKKGAISFSAKKAVLPKKDVLYIDGSVKNITPANWLDALDLKNEKGKQPFFVNPIILI